MLGHLGTWIAKLFNEGSKQLKTARGRLHRTCTLHRRPVRDNPATRKKGEGWGTGREIESGKNRKLRRSRHKVARASNPLPVHETAPYHPIPPQGYLSPAAQPRHPPLVSPFLSKPGPRSVRDCACDNAGAEGEGRGQRRRRRQRQLLRQ